jgi:hypothetical protein
MKQKNQESEFATFYFYDSGYSGYQVTKKSSRNFENAQKKLKKKLGADYDNSIDEYYQEYWEEIPYNKLDKSIQEIWDKKEPFLDTKKAGTAIKIFDTGCFDVKVAESICRNSGATHISNKGEERQKIKNRNVWKILGLSALFVIPFVALYNWLGVNGIFLYFVLLSIIGSVVASFRLYWSIVDNHLWPLAVGAMSLILTVFFWIDYSINNEILWLIHGIFLFFILLILFGGYWLYERFDESKLVSFLIVVALVIVGLLWLQYAGVSFNVLE